MPDVTPIDRAIDLIEGNLMAAVTVADMAAAAGYSLFHFSRTFNQATHHTPYDYLMRRRLSEAAQTLVRTDRKIKSVASGLHGPLKWTRKGDRIEIKTPQLKPVDVIILRD